ncbi:MAG: group 1 glycosyl transferase, partial [Gammaproteobacteria bacterium SHHR-1]
MKNILFLSTSYPLNLSDWKGLFIRHLADALARHEQICLQLWAPPGETHPEITRVTTRTDD